MMRRGKPSLSPGDGLAAALAMIAAILLPARPAAAAGKRAFGIEDFYRVRVPSHVALSPDEQTLYVSAVGVIMSYDIGGDGSLSEGRVFHDGGADGLAVDVQGRLYAAASRSGVLVLDADGTHLGSFVPGDRVSNVAFGENGSTLFVTGVQLVRIRLEARGLGF